MKRILVHAHTTYSRDGRLTPEQLAQLARSHGFDAVLVSDHWEHLDRLRLASLVADCERQWQCLLIPGYERDWDGYHLCAFGVRSWSNATDLATWVDAVHEEGGLVCLAHPARYGFSVPETVLDACDAVEVWNSKRPYDGGLAPNPDAGRLLRTGVLAVAGQDFHRRSDLSSVALVLDRDTPGEQIVSEIRAGRFSITSRWIRFDRQPSSRMRPILRAWQSLRPALWVVPIGVFRLLKRFRKGQSR